MGTGADVDGRWGHDHRVVLQYVTAPNRVRENTLKRWLASVEDVITWLSVYRWVSVSEHKKIE